jgi:hypothetical protein
MGLRAARGIVSGKTKVKYEISQNIVSWWLKHLRHSVTGDKCRWRIWGNIHKGAKAVRISAMKRR